MSKNLEKIGTNAKIAFQKKLRFTNDTFEISLDLLPQI